MINVVEAAFNIAFNNPLVGKCMSFSIFGLSSWSHCLTDMLQGSVTTSTGPKAIGDMPKSCFKKGLNDLFYCTLYNTVFYGRYTKGPEFPRFTILGYPYTARGAWQIAARA